VEILINELSLTGQFKNEDDFLDSFDYVLKLIKLIEKLEFSILKEYNFFQSKITIQSTLNIFLRLRTDRARKMKQFLLKLAYNPPYWNDTQKHNCFNDNYTYASDNICNTSLAESCERDRIVLSFNHQNFLKNNLLVQKNNDDIDIYNFIDKNHFLKYLLSISKIEALNYCKLKYKNSNLNFSLLEGTFGFDILGNAQQKIFIKKFNDFSQMTWSNIQKNSKLNYKQYNGDWFKNTEYSQKNIFKFRTSQKYRCFGYREKDVFFVLRFEIDHKISDNG